jgi:hypothetical protein
MALVARLIASSMQPSIDVRKRDGANKTVIFRAIACVTWLAA